MNPPRESQACFSCPSLTHPDLHLPILSHRTLKASVIPFCSHRRKEGHTWIEQHVSEVEPPIQVMIRQLRTLTRISVDSGAAANDRGLSHPDRTQLNPRPMCGRRSMLSTQGSTVGHCGRCWACPNAMEVTEDLHLRVRLEILSLSPRLSRVGRAWTS